MEALKLMYEHPIATFFFIGVITWMIVEIINAIKG
jgi:hypothetical protein